MPLLLHGRRTGVIGASEGLVEVVGMADAAGQGGDGGADGVLDRVMTSRSGSKYVPRTLIVRAKKEGG